MRETEFASDIMAVLAETPFLQRVELASFVTWSVWAVYKAVDPARNSGLIASVPASSETQRHEERYHLTAAGIEVAARLSGIDFGDFLSPPSCFRRMAETPSGAP